MGDNECRLHCTSAEVGTIRNNHDRNAQDEHSRDHDINEQEDTLCNSRNKNDQDGNICSDTSISDQNVLQRLEPAPPRVVFPRMAFLSLGALARFRPSLPASCRWHVITLGGHRRPRCGRELAGAFTPLPLAKRVLPFREPPALLQGAPPSVGPGRALVALSEQMQACSEHRVGGSGWQHPVLPDDGSHLVACYGLGAWSQQSFAQDRAASHALGVDVRYCSHMVSGKRPPREGHRITRIVSSPWSLCCGPWLHAACPPQFGSALVTQSGLGSCVRVSRSAACPWTCARL